MLPACDTDITVCLGTWSVRVDVSAVTGAKTEISSNAYLSGNVRLPFKELLCTYECITAPCLPFNFKFIAETIRKIDKMLHISF